MTLFGCIECREELKFGLVQSLACEIARTMESRTTYRNVRIQQKVDRATERRINETIDRSGPF